MLVIRTEGAASQNNQKQNEDYKELIGRHSWDYYIENVEVWSDGRIHPDVQVHYAHTEGKLSVMI